MTLHQRIVQVHMANTTYRREAKWSWLKTLIFVCFVSLFLWLAIVGAGFAAKLLVWG